MITAISSCVVMTNFSIDNRSFEKRLECWIQLYIRVSDEVTIICNCLSSLNLLFPMFLEENKTISEPNQFGYFLRYVRLANFAYLFTYFFFLGLWQFYDKIILRANLSAKKEIWNRLLRTITWTIQQQMNRWG